MVGVLCLHCGSEKLVRDGKSVGGKQRYLCRACGRRSRATPYQGRPPEVEEQVLALLQERMSQRGISRALKISRVTVAAIQKKTPSSCSTNSDKAV